MTVTPTTYVNGRVFDGEELRDDLAARFVDGRLSALMPADQVIDGGEIIDLDGDVLSPGYVDLQVNGGDGIMLNDAPSVETLRRMARAHRGLGVTAFLPTLITDTPEKTLATIKAVRTAIDVGVEGIAGLHLEGPHLSIARKGAHDPTLIRPMEDPDLAELLDAAGTLPVLKATVAPENVTEAQVRQLAAAGVLVSLGHTDADYDACRRYFDAGARCVTHLFNAMSQLGSRTPGLVGAALAAPQVSAGLIADAIHVHPQTIRAALAAKTGPGQVFLVSDSMAVAGSGADRFELGGRTILRRDGRLTLSDGTLAGADLDLTTAIRVMVEQVGLDLAAALRMATSIPAQLIGRDMGLRPGRTHVSDVIRISRDLTGVSLLG